MKTTDYFIQYEVHTDEEGWYGYLIPADPRCRAIRYIGPVLKKVATEWLRKHKEQM